MQQSFKVLIPCALLALSVATPALADEPLNCDFFRNSLIGSRCAQTYSVGMGASASDFTTSERYNWGGANGKYDTKFNSQDLTGHLAFTPTSWLTISASSSYTWHQHSWTDAFNGQPAWTGSSSHSGNGMQNVGASVNLYDSGAGADNRYVFGLYAGYGVQPSAVWTERYSEISGGLAAGAQWRVGSGYSLNAKASVGIQRFAVTGYSSDQYVGSARLLLSNDIANIAFGPTFHTTYLATLNFPASHFSNHLGAVVIAAPFKSSSSQFMSGLVLEAGYSHSLGNGWFPTEVTATSQELHAKASFNFKY
jgi:hypothetical protein